MAQLSARAIRRTLGDGPALTPLHTHHQQLQQLVARLGQDAVASLVLLLDRDGQAVASWHRIDQLDVAAVAAVSMGGLLARHTLGQQIGGGSPRPTTTHEYDGQVVLTIAVDERLALLLMIEDHSRLGLARLALRRGAEQIATLRAELPLAQS